MIESKIQIPHWKIIKFMNEEDKKTLKRQIQIPHWKIIKLNYRDIEIGVTEYSNSSLEDNQAECIIDTLVRPSLIQIPHWKIIKAKLFWF